MLTFNLKMISIKSVFTSNLIFINTKYIVLHANESILMECYQILWFPIISIQLINTNAGIKSHLLIRVTTPIGKKNINQISKQQQQMTTHF